MPLQVSSPSCDADASSLPYPHDLDFQWPSKCMAGYVVRDLVRGAPRPEGAVVIRFVCESPKLLSYEQEQNPWMQRRDAHLSRRLRPWPFISDNSKDDFQGNPMEVLQVRGACE